MAMSNKEAMALVEELGGDPQTMFKWRNNGVRFFRRDSGEVEHVHTLHRTEILNRRFAPTNRSERNLLARYLYKFSTGGYDTKTTCTALRELCSIERLPISFAIKKGKIVMTYFGMGRDIKFNTTVSVLHETKTWGDVRIQVMQIISDTGETVQSARWI